MASGPSHACGFLPSMIGRRDFIALAFGSGLGATVATVAPRFADGQSRPPLPRIAYLGSTSAPTPTSPSLVFQAFVNSLHDLGYVEGQNVIVESRWANGQAERLPALAEELLHDGVDVLCPVGAVTIRVAKAKSATIPMVFALVVDPVAIGLVASWQNPGRNLTGVTTFDPDQARQQLAILKETIPDLQRVTLIIDGAIPDRANLVQVNAAAGHSLGIETLAFEIQAPAPRIDEAFAAAKAQHAGAVLVVEHPATTVYRKAIGEAAVKFGMPTMFGRDYPDAGGLMAYGTAFSKATRRIPIYVDKILKGARPGDLPIERVNEPELIVNLKIAHQIGIRIPNSITDRASQLIN
jgi:putative ABC transport system substrate-binding protein